MTKYIYLHGFCSSSKSEKVSYLRSVAGWELCAPDIPDKPSDAIPFLHDWFDGALQESLDQVVLIGSSLGSYYADYFARKYLLPAALINPLVDVDDMQPMLGMNNNYYTDTSFELDANDLSALKSISHDMSITIPRVILLDEGDELLDYHKAVKKYENFAQVLQYPGGSHRFEHLDVSLGKIEGLSYCCPL